MCQGEENEKASLRQEYPLLRSEVPTTSQEWLERKRVRDKTAGLWRIHNELYDLTDFVALHPGGTQWIAVTKGTDITEAFETHHLKGTAEAHLSNYLVRKASTPRIQPFTFEAEGFYKTLKPKIVSILSELPKSVRKESDRIIDSLLVVLMLLSTLSCWAWSFNVVLSLFLVFLNTWVLSFLVTSAHSYFHRADNWRMYLFNLNGQFFEQWRISHSLSHHLFTNTSEDAEISFVEPMLQFLPFKDKPMWARMAFSYWPLAGVILFIRPVWRQVFGEEKTPDKYPWRWTQAIQFFLPAWMFILGGQSMLVTLFLWTLTSFFSSFYFVLFGLTAGHLTPDTIFEGDFPSYKPIDWGVYQIKTTIDRAEYAGRSFKSITRFGDHALHHLFPTLDQSELKYMYPVLQEHCKQFGIEIKTTSFAYALANVFRQLMRKGPKQID